MSNPEQFFKDVGYKLQDMATAPTRLINSLVKALESPTVFYALCGIGGIFVLKFMKTG